MIKIYLVSRYIRDKLLKHTYIDKDYVVEVKSHNEMIKSIKEKDLNIKDTSVIFMICRKK